MGRVHVEMPESFSFATEIDVRITDLNYGRHLGNDSMLGLIHEARVRFLAHHGLTEADVDGKPLVLADAVIAYRAEAFAGERLRFEVAVGEVGRVGCDLVYRVTRPADGRLVAEAKTGLVFLDPTSRRPTALPQSIARLA